MDGRFEGDPRRLEELRRRAWHLLVSSAGGPEAVRAGKAGAGSSPRQSLRRNAVREFIRGLALDERMVVILRYLEGFTTQEISATLEVSDARVDELEWSVLRRIGAHVGAMLEVERGHGVPRLLPKCSISCKRHAAGRTCQGRRKRVVSQLE